MTISDYITYFKTVYAGEPWFGDSFRSKLKDVTEKEAFIRPTANTHCLAELLSHVIYWRVPLIKRLQGDFVFQASMEEEGNWLPFEKLKAKGWAQILKEFDECQSELIATLERTPNSFLKEPFRNGHNMEYLVSGVLQHDIYHLGQVGLVRSMLLQV